MNALMFYTVFLVFGTASTSVSDSDVKALYTNETPISKRLIHTQASLQRSRAFFQITVSNDNGTGYYSLKRYENDGKVTIVECLEIKSGQSIRTYKFEDIAVPSADCTYELVRVETLSKENHIIGTWLLDNEKDRFVELLKN